MQFCQDDFTAHILPIKHMYCMAALHRGYTLLVVLLRRKFCSQKPTFPPLNVSSHRSTTASQKESFCTLGTELLISKRHSGAHTSALQACMPC